MRLSFAGWLKENFGLVATLLGFTVDTITLIALINSKVPPTIPLSIISLMRRFNL
jgi:hypothetical protein